MNKKVSFTIEIAIIIVILLALFIIPSIYMHRSTDRLYKVIDRLIEQTYNQDFDESYRTIQELKSMWEKEKHIRAITVGEEYIMDIDNSIIQCETAIKTEDHSSSYEYANILRHTLEETLFSIQLNFDNVF